jgi:hypothetical protein
MKRQDRYILVDVQEQQSRLNGGVFHRFTWYSVEDGTYWETDADSAYNNYRKNGWDHLVTDPNPYGSYQGLTRTQRTAQSGLGVITADSRPALQVRVASREEAQALAELDTDLRRRRSNYGDLFE